MKTKHLTPLQRQKIYELENMAPDKFEAICKRCGVCCLCKMDLKPIESRTVFMRVRCAHLNPRTKLCEIYPGRLQASHDCSKVDMNIILHSDLIPDSCGYREYIFGPAKHPAKIDFNKTCSEDEIDFDDPADVFPRIIIDSHYWTQR